MGRSYWFDCPKCGYQAKVSGRADRGVGFAVQTVSCRDCKCLYDAVTAVKVPDITEPRSLPRREPGLPSNLLGAQRTASVPPTLASVANRLYYFGAKEFKWIKYKLQCPASPAHRVQVWNDPGKCPHCGTYLDRAALPFRLWD
jgi:hypothetical protein